MATKYLEKFEKLIDKRQVDQVLKLLNSKKQSGEIRTLEEFTQELDRLVRELTGTILIPTLKLFMAKPNEIIDSSTYNFMLERIKDDLESSFEEAGNIEDVQQAHRAIIKDVMFKNLRYGIAELEKKINLYRYMNTGYGGYNKSISESFDEVTENRVKLTANRTGDINIQTNLFFDPKDGELFDVGLDAIVDEVGEHLRSAQSQLIYHTVKDVRQVFDEDYPASCLKVQLPTTHIRNLIDGQTGTYWIQTLLFETLQSEVSIKLEFVLNGVSDVNFLEIEPVSYSGFTLVSIDYESGEGIVGNIETPDVLLLAPYKTHFKRVAARKIILTFSSSNAVPLEFEYVSGEETLFNQAKEEPKTGYNPSLKKIENDLNGIMSSTKIKDIVGILDGNRTTFSGYEYLFGFDNIRIGLSTYQYKSIYISYPLTLKDVGLLGLKASEKRPYASSLTGDPVYTSTTYDTSDSYYFFSSIEYYVIKRDIDQFHNILQTTWIPMIPLDKERIHHERLILTEKSSGSLEANDIGHPMFFTSVLLGDIKVYRNGTLLTYGTDWTDVTSDDDETPDIGYPMRFKVKLSAVDVNDIFTISYDPATSSIRSVPSEVSAYDPSVGTNIVDLKGDTTIRLFRDNSVILDKGLTESKIAYTYTYLAIVLRNNSAREGLTALVEDYNLLIGTRDAGRFRD